MADLKDMSLDDAIDAHAVLDALEEAEDTIRQRAERERERAW